MHDVMRAQRDGIILFHLSVRVVNSSRARLKLTARITSCLKYLINRILNNNLRYTIIVLVWHSILTKEN